MRLAALGLTFCLLVPASSLAADVRPVKEDPAVVLSRFVLSEEAWSRMQAGTAAQLQQYVEGAVRQEGTKVPEGFAAQFAKEFARIVSYPEIIDLQAGLLSKYYSAAEMKTLLAFYKTPLGQKVIRVMPEVSQDVNGQMLVILQQRLPGVVERVKAALAADAAGAEASSPKP